MRRTKIFGGCFLECKSRQARTLWYLSRIICSKMLSLESVTSCDMSTVPPSKSLLVFLLSHSLLCTTSALSTHPNILSIIINKQQQQRRRRAYYIIYHSVDVTYDRSEQQQQNGGPITSHIAASSYNTSSSSSLPP